MMFFFSRIIYLSKYKDMSEDSQEMPQTRSTTRGNRKKEIWGTNYDKTNATYNAQRKKNDQSGTALEWSVAISWWS